MQNENGRDIKYNEGQVRNIIRTWSKSGLHKNSIGLVLKQPVTLLTPHPDKTSLDDIDDVSVVGEDRAKL